ncbi:hydrocephalus-inducing protein homolog [Limulus polyphemus]|uniref:Hydrocephalus-inducing protein homolog n=1 Tax=Limulus polyphemus TaxID=6850 RepID=A0ABM1TB85_LIMPO|nr:hydrocephalus-inducing protein homolog [Limulus polyphemus]
MTSSQDEDKRSIEKEESNQRYKVDSVILSKKKSVLNHSSKMKLKHSKLNVSQNEKNSKTTLKHQKGEVNSKTHQISVDRKASKAPSEAHVGLDTDKLQSSLNYFQKNFEQISEILASWDRKAENLVDLKSGSRSESSVQGKIKSLKEKEKETLKDELGQISEMTSDQKFSTIGVPHIIVPSYLPLHILHSLLFSSGMLPSVEEVLQSLNISPNNPSFPRSTTFTVLSIPPEETILEYNDTFFFVAPPVEDEYDNKEKDINLQATDWRSSPQHQKATSKKDKSKALHIRQPSVMPRAGKDLSVLHTFPDWVSQEDHDEPRKQSTHRWVLYPNTELTLIVGFQSDTTGSFQKTFHLELIGIQGVFQIDCHGTACFPSIYVEIFSHASKSTVQQTYKDSSKCFDFGPLFTLPFLEGVSKETEYPGNSSTLTFKSSSLSDVEVHFFISKKEGCETFSISPNQIVIFSKPTYVRVDARPHFAGLHEANIVCCVKKNPEPLILRVSCLGISPELALDKKVITFEKLPVYRSHADSIVLTNSSPLSMSWKLDGLEVLGSEFIVPIPEGIINSFSTYAVKIFFRALAPVIVSKKQIKLERKLAGVVCIFLDFQNLVFSCLIPTCLLELAVRTQVSDPEGLLGVLHTESILVQAEAFDLVVDISFTKGKDILKFLVDVFDLVLDISFTKGKDILKFLVDVFDLVLDISFTKGKDILKFLVDVFDLVLDISFTKGKDILKLLVEVFDLVVDISFTKGMHDDMNFGIVRVGEENKISCSLKNRSKHETTFSFIIQQPAEVKLPDLSKILTVVPSKGVIPATEKPLTVQVVFCSKEELIISDLPVLICYIGEVADNGSSATSVSSGVITFPIHVTAEATFSHFRFLPSDELNLGSLPVGTKRNNTINLENTGIFEFNFNICEQNKEESGGLNINILPSKRTTTKNVKMDDSFLQTERFSLFPSSGVIPPKSTCVITLDTDLSCIGNFKLDLTVLISDMNPKKYPHGIPYSVRVEACLPSLNTTDIEKIFEETYICNSLLSPEVSCLKVVLEVGISIKQLGGKQGGRPSEVFEITPDCCTIHPGGHTYLTLKYSPKSIQIHNAMFEAAVNISTPHGPSLVFELVGEGILPRIIFLQPRLYDEQNSLIMLFNKLIVGCSQCLPLVLKNTDLPPAQVKIVFDDPEGAFQLKSETKKDISAGSDNLWQLTLLSGEVFIFHVIFTALYDKHFESSLELNVMNNPFEQQKVRLLGKGYTGMVSVEVPIIPKINNVDEGLVTDVNVTPANHLVFSNCYVNKTYNQVIVLTNQFSSNPVKFVCPLANPELTFWPQEGYLLPQARKKINATFMSEVPMNWTRKLLTISCVIMKESQETFDWDTRMETTTWSPLLPGEQSQNWDNATCYSQTRHKSEPEHTLYTDSPLELDLFVTIVCDCSRFSVDTTTINFPDTYLFMTSVSKFNLQNTSVVPLAYQWSVALSPANCSDNGSCSSLTRADTITPSVLASSSMMSPFSIYPSSGIIPPAESAVILVKFSPTLVAHYKSLAKCCVSEGEGPDLGTTIELQGKGILPFCHFWFPDPDFSPLQDFTHFKTDSFYPKETRFLAIENIGIDSKCIKSFYLVNVTNKIFKFCWRKHSIGESPQILCLTPQGSVAPGKKFKIQFKYHSLTVETLETLWTCHIQRFSVNYTFVILCKTTEPKVIIDPPFLDFSYVLIDERVSATVNLVNDENVPLTFYFNAKKMTDVYTHGLISIQPDKGTLSPSSQKVVLVGYKPVSEGYVNHTLQCLVKGKSQPLALNIKAKGVNLDISTCVAQSSNCYVVDFGKVDLGEKSEETITLWNRSCVDTTFSCSLFDVPNGYVALQKHQGELTAKQKAVLFLTFQPTSCCTLNQSKLRILILQADMWTYQYIFICHYIFCLAVLSPESISYQQKKIPHFVIDFENIVLSPGGSAVALISFKPREKKIYNDRLTFSVNGIIQKSFEVCGEGVELKLIVCKPDHRVINFGSVLKGQKSSKFVDIVNQSSALLNVTFKLRSTDEQYSTVPESLTLSPSNQVCLRPVTGVVHLEITFMPTFRVPTFCVALVAEVLGITRVLSAISGCCKIVQLQLLPNVVQFGAVVQGCQLSYTLLFHNIGDLTSRRFYIKNIPCQVEGGENVFLTLLGSCIKPTVIREKLSFSVKVRQSETQYIKLINPINESVVIQPVYTGQWWTGPKELSLTPHGSGEYPITYSPLKMSKESIHKGSIFFPFPNGDGFFTELEGVSEAPVVNDVIVRNILSNKLHTEKLTVVNWLFVKQSFHVHFEWYENTKLSEQYVQLSGHKLMDVPACGNAEYNLLFKAFKEGTYHFKVVFKNEEYQFFELTFLVTPAPIVDVINLNITVRQRMVHIVTVNNPLNKMVTFTVHSSLSDVKHPEKVMSLPQTDTTLQIEVFCLLSGHQEGTLELRSSELDLYRYKLVLDVFPSLVERSVIIQTTLGSSSTLPLTFKNYYVQKLDFVCKVDNQNFMVEKVITASGNGVDSTVNVTFDPQHQGETCGMLTVSSSIGGEYKFKLMGQCDPPKPQGPLIIHASNPVTIHFRNVFSDQITFSFRTSSPHFSVSKTTETLKPRKDTRLQVTFDARASALSTSVMGRLIITCPVAVDGSPIEWIYYLKGSVLHTVFHETRTDVPLS